MKRPHRKMIKLKVAAEMLDCSADSLRKGRYGLKLYPQNPDTIHQCAWLVEENEVLAVLKRRDHAAISR